MFSLAMMLDFGEMMDNIFEKKGNIKAKIVVILYYVFVLITFVGLISAMVVFFGKHQNANANAIFTLIMFILSEIFALLTIIFYHAPDTI